MILRTGDAEPLGADPSLVLRAYEAFQSDHINIVAYRPGQLNIEAADPPYSTDADFHARCLSAWLETVHTIHPGSPEFLYRIKEVGYTRGWLRTI